MINWTPFPKDLQFAVYNLFFNIDWFYEFFFNDIILPTNNPKLKESFADFFNHIDDARLIYDAVNENIPLIEKKIKELNQMKGDTKEFASIFNLMKDVIYDLNMTYFNIGLLVSNEAFQFIPSENLSAEQRITELNATTEKLSPIVQGMAVQKAHFDKYLLELNFLEPKLRVNQSN